MIRIYMSKNDLDKKIIHDCEAFFRAKVSSLEFGDDDLWVLSEIDEATLLDSNTGAIKTPFGITDCENLSTGCKTVLSYLYIIRHKEKYKGIVIDVTECGYNALECLFVLMDKYNDSDTILLLEHSNYIHLCSERNYIINDKYKVNHLSASLLMNSM